MTSVPQINLGITAIASASSDFRPLRSTPCVLRLLPLARNIYRFHLPHIFRVLPTENEGNHGGSRPASSDFRPLHLTPCVLRLLPLARNINHFHSPHMFRFHPAAFLLSFAVVWLSLHVGFSFLLVTVVFSCFFFFVSIQLRLCFPLLLFGICRFS